MTEVGYSMQRAQKSDPALQYLKSLMNLIVFILADEFQMSLQSQTYYLFKQGLLDMLPKHNALFTCFDLRIKETDLHQPEGN